MRSGFRPLRASEQKPPAGRSAGGCPRFIRIGNEGTVQVQTSKAKDETIAICKGEDWYPPPNKVRTRHFSWGSRTTPCINLSTFVQCQRILLSRRESVHRKRLQTVYIYKGQTTKFKLWITKLFCPFIIRLYLRVNLIGQ